MFLSDIAEFARSKKNTDWLRENDPIAYKNMKQSQNYLTKELMKYDPKRRSKEKGLFTPRRNRYRQQKDIAFPFSRTENNSFRQWNQELPSRLQRRGKLPELQAPINSGVRLPDLRNAQRGVAPLPVLQPTTRPVLPDLSQIPTRWNKPSFDVLASKHDVTGIVNPVKNTFKSTSGRKPVSQVIVPKMSQPSAKDTSKLLKNLGVAGVVGGGVLGAYGLKKYMDSRNKDKRR